jgi:hypothetical protein
MNTPRSYWWLIGLLIAFAVVLLSPLASAHPDGLECVAEDQGFLQRAKEAPFVILPDYVFPGIRNEAVATIIAGLVGALAVFGVMYGVAWIVRRRTSQPAD